LLLNCSDGFIGEWLPNVNSTKKELVGLGVVEDLR